MQQQQGGQPMQYAPQAPMMVRPRPNPKGIPVDAAGQREWTHGLFNCFEECGSCALAYCLCACPTYSLIETKYNSLQMTGAPHPQGGDMCAAPFWMMCGIQFLTGAGCLLALGQRSKVRDRYGIRGDGFKDCLVSWCCLPCEQVQALRELEEEEKSLVNSGLTNPMQPQQPYHQGQHYQAPPPMTTAQHGEKSAAYTGGGGGSPQQQQRSAPTSYAPPPATYSPPPQPSPVQTGGQRTSYQGGTGGGSRSHSYQHQHSYQNQPHYSPPAAGGYPQQPQHYP